MNNTSVLLIAMLIALLVGLSLVFDGREQQQEHDVFFSTPVNATFEPNDPAPTSPDIDLDRLLGHIDAANDTSFSRVRAPYGDQDGLYLLDEVYDAFVAMHRAAREDGIALVIVSAMRDFDSQKEIWERKWTGARLVDDRNLAMTVPDPIERARIILKYSSMPGTSRHHWGTDIDINSVENAYFESGAGAEVYEWLAGNASDFGFRQTYTAKGDDRPYGYEEEPWHWSYCPVAKRYLQQYIEKVTYDDISGFEGSDTAAEVDVIAFYVLGINSECIEH